MNADQARVEWLTVAGHAETWRAIGLTVADDGLIPLLGTSLRLVPPSGPGGSGGQGAAEVSEGERPASALTGWAFSGIAPTDSVAGFAAEVVEPQPPRFAAHHLGASQLDHVVIFTNDMDSVSGAIEAATGCERKRVREAGSMRQGFHRIGRGGLIVEVVEHADRAGAAEMWGLVMVVDDLDKACELLGTDLVSDPKDAVQPGRRIATIRRSAGLGTAVALMSA